MGSGGRPCASRVAELSVAISGRLNNNGAVLNIYYNL